MSRGEIENLVLILTSQCNLRCTYCYQTGKNPLRIGWDTLRESIDLALGCSSDKLSVLFLGGEPLLEWPLIPKSVDYLNAKLPAGKRVAYEISTNGLLITDKIAEFFDRNEFEVQLSFDGIAEAQNYRHEGTFASVDTLLNRLREDRPALLRHRLRTSTILIPAAIPFLANSVRYFTGKGVRHITICASLTPRPGWRRERIDELDAQFQSIYDDSFSHFEKTGEVPLELFRRPQEDSRPGKDDDTCNAVRGKTLAVDADGQLYGCALFAESYQEFPPGLLRNQLAPLKLGNLEDKGFTQRSARYRGAIRKKPMFGEREKRYSSYGRCADCPYLDSCRVCPVAIGFDPANTDPHRVPDFICAFNRVALKYRRMFPSMPDPIERLKSLASIGGRHHISPNAERAQSTLCS